MSCATLSPLATLQSALAWLKRLYLPKYEESILVLYITKFRPIYDDLEMMDINHILMCMKTRLPTGESCHEWLRADQLLSAMNAVSGSVPVRPLAVIDFFWRLKRFEIK